MAKAFASQGDMAAKKISFTEIGRDLYAFTAEGDPNTGVIIGDDGVMLEVVDGQLLAHPHPETRGLLEVRNLGLLRFDVCESAEVALVLTLDREAPRHIEAAETTERLGIALPKLRLWPDSPVLAIRAELALERFGLA